MMTLKKKFMDRLLGKSDEISVDARPHMEW